MIDILKEWSRADIQDGLSADHPKLVDATQFRGEKWRGQPFLGETFPQHAQAQSALMDLVNPDFTLCDSRVIQRGFELLFRNTILPNILFLKGAGKKGAPFVDLRSYFARNAPLHQIRQLKEGVEGISFGGIDIAPFQGLNSFLAAEAGVKPGDHTVAQVSGYPLPLYEERALDRGQLKVGGLDKNKLVVRVELLSPFEATQERRKAKTLERLGNPANIGDYAKVVFSSRPKPRRVLPPVLQAIENAATEPLPEPVTIADTMWDRMNNPSPMIRLQFKDLLHLRYGLYALWAGIFLTSSSAAPEQIAPVVQQVNQQSLPNDRLIPVRDVNPQADLIREVIAGKYDNVQLPGLSPEQRYQQIKDQQNQLP